MLLCDTAGRLHIDEDMMEELAEIKQAVEVHQTILVIDAMTGQDAVNVAKEFNEKVGIDGVIVCKGFHRKISMLTKLTHSFLPQNSPFLGAEVIVFFLTSPSVTVRPSLSHSLSITDF